MVVYGLLSVFGAVVTSDNVACDKLPQIDLIPTGGVSLATAKEFLEAGAFALGVGSDLVNAKAMAEGKPEIVTESARKYLGIVREFRELAKQNK